jgi:hypothetical protein
LDLLVVTLNITLMSIYKEELVKARVGDIFIYEDNLYRVYTKKYRFADTDYIKVSLASQDDDVTEFFITGTDNKVITHAPYVLEFKRYR